MQYKSEKRAAQADERDQVRALVLARDRGCIARDVITEVRCGSPDLRRPAFEVDEVRGGSWRITEWLDAARCWSMCQNHHDHKTANKRDVLRRMRAAGRLTDEYTVKGP